jgi:hypothetical protein
MRFESGRLSGLVFCLLAVSQAVASAAEISPHRALYSMTLASAKPSSGVLGASGAMVYEWGETCDGWTVQQRFRLRLIYADSDPVELTSSLVSWESKDGLNYRFNERRLKNGDPDEELRGDAHLDGVGGAGKAEFTKPQDKTFVLPAGTLFPTAHTILLIDRANKGETFISRNVFDGATLENASQISAVIGPLTPPPAAKHDNPKAEAVTANGPASGGKQSGDAKSAEMKPNQAPADTLSNPLLDRPSWRVRLAFFSADANEDEPDYELGMRLFENGVSTDMVLDYTDYVVSAKLDDIEPLPKPSC